ncbi:MAG: AMP-binding protein, partial [Vitreoscilla sp.]
MLKLTRTALIAFGLCAASALAPVLAADAPAGAASAPLPAAVRARVAAQTGVAVVESYGMTEAASQITATPLSGGHPAGSVGRPVGVELEV